MEANLAWLATPRWGVGGSTERYVIRCAGVAFFVPRKVIILQLFTNPDHFLISPFLAPLGTSMFGAVTWSPNIPSRFSLDISCVNEPRTEDTRCVITFQNSMPLSLIHLISHVTILLEPKVYTKHGLVRMPSLCLLLVFSSDHLIVSIEDQRSTT